MSSIFDDKELINKLIEAGKSVRKYGQGQDPNMVQGDPSTAPLPPGVTEDQIKQEYEAYKKQIEAQRAQVAQQNQQAEQFNRANPGKPQKFVQSVPVMVDYNNFRSSYIGRTSAQQSMDDPSRGITPQIADTYRLAKKLLLSIKDQVQPGSVTKEAPLDFGAAQAPEIKPENLKTLGDFLSWAAINKVTWDGQRIAWDYDPEANPPSTDKPDIDNPWVFESYQKDRDRDQYTRQARTRNYYANKDALLKFLTYLRDTQAAKENKVFEVMIGKVIGQVNQFLQPGEQIGPRPEDKPAAAFNDNDIVDGFPSQVLDIKKAYDGIEQYAPAFTPAPMKLTYGDIKDLASLQNWVSKMRDAAHPDANPTGPDGYACGIIHILYLRARYLSGQVRYDRLRPKYSALAKVYLDNVTNFGKQFTDNGQPCAVTQPGTQAPGQQPGQKPGQQGQGRGGGRINPQALQQLAALRPFNTQWINFQEINNFMDRYAPLANKPGITAMVAQVKDSMDDAEQYMGTAGAPIQLDNLTGAKVKSMTTQPVPLLNALYTVISYAGRVYLDFYTEFKTILGEEAARPVEQQITSGGPQQTNITTLLRVKENLMNEARTRR